MTHPGIPVEDHVRLFSRTPRRTKTFASHAFSGMDRQHTPGLFPADRILVLTDFEYATINDTPDRAIQYPIYAEHGYLSRPHPADRVGG
ncbi:hypothetical protein JYT92_00675, partial [bacterium AH-315-L15]|nr:hypothetical protein [bacterium AH-315-L15]